MVMGREWLKGMCWIGTQIIRKSLRSRLRCAVRGARVDCRCGGGLWIVLVDLSGGIGKRGGPSITRAWGNTSSVALQATPPMEVASSSAKNINAYLQFTYFPLHLPFGITE